MLETSAATAAWFLPAVLPICLYVAWSDMRTMKIPNIAVYVLVAVYAVIGLIVLDLNDYLWRWSHLGVALVAGIVLNLIRLIGAGDAKFIAASGPFIATADLRALIPIYILSFLASYLVHRIAKFTPIRQLAPDWTSWDAGKRFPMGFALATTLVVYLVLAVRPDWYAAALGILPALMAL